MIDIHCHFLPGIDDGPSTMDEAAALAQVALADGITYSIVTPHVHPGRWDNDAATIIQAVTDFRKELLARNIPLEIGFAAEVRLTDLIFGQLAALQLPFLGKVAGFSLLLLEFPHGQLIPGSNLLVDWLIKRGIRPVIAHPERNKAIMRDYMLLEPFVDAGCLLQVTAGSLTGAFGAAAETVALRLLDEDRITYVATDAHNMRARRPVLSEAFALVSARKGATTAARLFEDNQRVFLPSDVMGLACG
jgi:protein-tyrosine phosphatase